MKFILITLFCISSSILYGAEKEDNAQQCEYQMKLVSIDEGVVESSKQLNLALARAIANIKSVPSDKRYKDLIPKYEDSERKLIEWEAVLKKDMAELERLNCSKKSDEIVDSKREPKEKTNFDSSTSEKQANSIAK